MYPQESDQPIHIAAFHGYSDIVRALVEDYGIDPNAKSYVCKNMYFRKITYFNTFRMVYNLFIMLHRKDVKML